MKQQVWERAAAMPFGELMFECPSYHLMFINHRGEREEMTDESRRLSDIRPFAAIFKFVERVGVPPEKRLDQQIAELIECKLDLSEIPLKVEIEDCHQSLQELCHEVVTRRANSSEEDRANYLYRPPMSLSQLPSYLEERYKNKGGILITVLYQSDDRIDDGCNKHTASVPYYQTASFVVRQVLIAKAKKGQGNVHQEDYNSYVLKICGRNEYLISEVPIHQYKFIRLAMIRDESPIVVLQKRLKLKLKECDLPNEAYTPPPLPKKIDIQTKTVWDIEAKYSMEFMYISDMNIGDETSMLRIKACLYHGEEPLCPVVQTNDVKASSPIWHELVKFDIDVADIPRMARLCIALFDKRKSKKARKGDLPIAWVNTMLFDHKGYLKSGDQHLTLWPRKREMEFEINPRGVIGPRPNYERYTDKHDDVDMEKYGTLSIKFLSYGDKIIYPPFHTVLQLAAAYAETELGSFKTNARDQAAIENLIEGDSLKVMSESEKEALWTFRVKCIDVPRSLPKLLQSLKWNRREEVAQMQALLQIWTELQAEDALELLDYKFADKAVREFAVKCLRKLNDDDLFQYLLQLTQALKYEPYLDCALSRFLLERALLSRRIGHFFFWYLRAEMHDDAVIIRFSMLLDAYLRSNQSHMKILQRQCDALKQMAILNEEMKEYLDENAVKDKLERYNILRNKLEDPKFKSSLCDFYCPLAPTCKAGNLIIHHCKIMDSKMKPLLLEFENASDQFSLGDRASRKYGEPILIMYKKGDDLRQDALTLQIFKIMENIWQEGGLDLRMIPYGTMPTGKETGLIEIVQNSFTLANIHKEIYGNTSGALRKDTLHTWMKKKNKDSGNFRRAIQEFRSSCAAYCVATYILGVGDRHSDNIMIKENGQLFHIDFGHFLGNFKYKFGIKRERVPFILTPDFVYIVKNDRDDNNTELSRFTDVCEKAFMLIREKGNMFINLFSMMVSAGIPELSSIRDIRYLLETLKLSSHEAEALRSFQGKYNDAVRNGWKATLNWVIHNNAKDN
ncbi:Phosphatidylinositol 4,5-bisphosphate 3-kinase catalytic subunit beta isoform [Trichoplax sp. H2]|nr:Phosphatidylinositol 4,5-bisphosphate 3-kinase catalytic subunit beta isoform [Trichoplax sp. H2]|eukprot:RDD40507.1 Phosphatidylinositol 4,5-bisphosphate 3-kinase catalytic subunit beta isoform [Trichoplax sp. H2]